MNAPVRITIEIGGDAPYGLDMVDEQGQRCNGLTLGEVLEQVLHFINRTPRAYPMHTPEEWQRRSDERAIAREPSNAPAARA